MSEAPARKLGQIGEYWLTRNRHGTWSATKYNKATRHTVRKSLGTTDFDEAVMALAVIVVRAQLQAEGDWRALRDLDARRLGVRHRRR